jgi:hypothetical protein
MTLDDQAANSIGAVFDELGRVGPALRRPLVGSIGTSRRHNMKEARSVGGHLRALFVFDPRRRAVVLLGGDKAGNWKGWYKQNIPLADRLYDRHVHSLGKEPSWQARTRAGARSVDRGR